MSRSKKDGNRGGAHQQHRDRGADFWSRRLSGMPSRNAYNKQRTHEHERRETTAIERDAVDEACDLLADGLVLFDQAAAALSTDPTNMREDYGRENNGDGTSHEGGAEPPPSPDGDAV